MVVLTTKMPELVSAQRECVSLSGSTMRTSSLTRRSSSDRNPDLLRLSCARGARLHPSSCSGANVIRLPTPPPPRLKTSRISCSNVQRTAPFIFIRILPVDKRKTQMKCRRQFAFRAQERPKVVVFALQYSNIPKQRRRAAPLELF